MTQEEAIEFVRLWQTSENAIEAAEKLGISAAAARNQASRFRKRGVPLKMRDRGRSRPSDYAALARLAEELGGEEEG